MLGGWALKSAIDGIFGHGGDHHYDLEMLKNVKGLNEQVQRLQISLRQLATVEKDLLALSRRTNYRLKQVENLLQVTLNMTVKNVTAWIQQKTLIELNTIANETKQYLRIYQDLIHHDDLNDR